GLLATPGSPTAGLASQSNHSQGRQTAVGHTRTNSPGPSRSIAPAAAGPLGLHLPAGLGASVPYTPGRRSQSAVPPWPRLAGPPPRPGLPNDDANPGTFLRSTSAQRTRPPPAPPSTRWWTKPRSWHSAGLPRWVASSCDFAYAAG